MSYEVDPSTSFPQPEVFEPSQLPQPDFSAPQEIQPAQNYINRISFDAGKNRNSEEALKLLTDNAMGMGRMELISTSYLTFIG
jgi:hypothetical protein